MSALAAQSHVRVGVGIFILRLPPGQTHLEYPEDIEFVIGKRKGSHGAGTWSLAGGHLEFNESFEACAVREAEEEVGLKIEDVKFFTATNDIMADAGKHYVTIFVTSRLADSTAEARLMEPDKCEEWKWISWREFLKWARAEIEALEIGHVVESENTSDVLHGRIFSPLLALVRQRPGLVPVL